MSLPAGLSMFPQAPIPPSVLPTLLVTPPDPETAAQISHLLSLYAFLVDNRSFPLMSTIFTPDFVANYSLPVGILQGMDNLVHALDEVTKDFSKSQHMLGTQVMGIQADGAVWCVTYLEARHWDKEHEEKYLDVFAQYQDFLVKDERTGQWRIKYRYLLYMGPMRGPLVEDLPTAKAVQGLEA